MRSATVFTVAAACVGFWGLVFWVADAFRPWELAAVVGGGAVLLVGWFWWERRHALPDPHEADLYVPQDWDWPDRNGSTVRHGGLGR